MSYFIDFADGFSKNGYSLFLYDYRGFGHSDSFSIDKDMLIYREFLADPNAAAYGLAPDPAQAERWVPKPTAPPRAAAKEKAK